MRQNIPITIRKQHTPAEPISRLSDDGSACYQRDGRDSRFVYVGAAGVRYVPIDRSFLDEKVKRMYKWSYQERLSRFRRQQ